MPSSARIWRRLMMPDVVRLHRYQVMPEQGPKILFFSGGSALNNISRVLKQYSHQSIHLVTPFDSGGSSAKLRAQFDMPAVGDLRSRLMALADETVMGQPEVYDLFTHRFAKQADQQSLQAELEQLVVGEHPLIACISNPMKALIQTQLAVMQDKIDESFDLQGASIGNLIIAGGYLNNLQQLDPIVFLFSRLTQTLGEVKTTVDAPFHLGVALENGDIVLGQHNITAKETSELIAPIQRIWLNKGLKRQQPINQVIAEDRIELINSAELICYPPGSFFSSLIANLLPQGVGTAICQNANPKVYVPNLGTDPEQLGYTLMTQVKTLTGIVLEDASQLEKGFGALDYLLIDDRYDYGYIDQTYLSELGVQVIKTPLIKDQPEEYDETLLVEALLSLT
ncbi:GAK system CofD-like protein [Marinomonas dokdonensis]|uniref:GAK system CofD-like protein n=1 Tax=Marinomonas dokdonensis TaxID=328224 RepID=UPI0040554808